jgi:tRNA threonylcarbamoyladenosine biosynthesis protein TsaB
MKSKLLAIETSTDACSVALSYNGEISEEFTVQPCKHSKVVLEMVNKLLSDTGLSVKQLDAIAFGRGPGSFTGVRLAASCVQGLAVSSGIGVIPVSTLRILAQGAYREYCASDILVAMNARMQEIYFGAYRTGMDNIVSALTEDTMVKVEEIEKILNEKYQKGIDWCKMGDGWSVGKVSNQTTTDNIRLYPRAKDLAIIAQKEWQDGVILAASEALPVYLRDKVTQ